MLVDRAAGDRVIRLTDARSAARARLQLLQGAGDDTTSEALEATCEALSLSLHDGDLFAAERVLALLKQHVPSRATLLAGYLQPLMRSELGRMREAGEDASRFVATARDLLLTERRPAADARSSGVLLVTEKHDRHALSLHMVALLLDEAGVPSTMLEADDLEQVSARLALREESAVCLAVSPGCDIAPLVTWLRNRQIAVVLLHDEGEATNLSDDGLGVSGAASRVTDVANMLLFLGGPLTASETAVLRLAADGLTNVRMAHELGLSVSAVKARLESAYVKLNAADRAHAVATALRNGWIR